MRRRLLYTIPVVLLAACTSTDDSSERTGSGGSPSGTVQSENVLIRGAEIIDGTGAPRRLGSIRIVDGYIAGVGVLAAEPGETVLEAAGLVVAPGFIDTHSHHDRGIFEMPDALAAVSQGITTVVVGQDGGSPSPLSDFFRRLGESPVAVNMASYAGHNSFRSEVLGDDFRRPATPGETARMVDLLAADMEAGALGLSTGLEYDPGLYSERDEVIALASEAARHGGRYISHLRSEDQYFWDALGELFDIGRTTGMPVQVSHMKLAMQGWWGQAGDAIDLIEQARDEGIEVTVDVYPYTYWQSTMTVIFPERDFEDRTAFEFALRDVVPPDGLLLTRYDPEPSYVGRTLAEIAEERQENPVDTYMMLVRESQALAKETGTGTESVIATSMHPADVAALIAWPHTNISSDGSLAGGHPRGYGAFPRVLGRYVSELGVMTLEEAVRKMTSLSAAHMGITDRGRIEPGAPADLVLFDPDRVLDRATPQDSQLTADGIERVWVNGVAVYHDGATTEARPGQVIRRSRN